MIKCDFTLVRSGIQDKQANSVVNVSTRSSCPSSVSDPFFQSIILRLEKGEKGTNLSAEYGVSTSNVVKGLSAWRIRAYPHWQTKLELSRQNQRTNFVMTSFCLLCCVRTENVEAVKKLSNSVKSKK